MKSIGEEVTEQLINEEFPTRKMQIDHLKEVSETIKTNPDLKENLQRELNQINGDTKEEKFEKTKSLLLQKMLTKSYNGFASTMFLSLITALIAGGSLFYVLLTNGYFN